MIQRIKQTLLDGVELRRNTASTISENIGKAIQVCLNSLKSGGKILFMGNGGSAADAQHLAGELVGRFLVERQAIPAISLSTDTSILTCLGNDYGFEKIFERQVEALGKKGDIAIGISTSGNSENIYRAFVLAKKLGITTIGFLGNKGSKIEKISEISLNVPSDRTPLIQEIHIAIGHIICGEIEKGMVESAST